MILQRIPVPDGVVDVSCSTVADGDFHLDGDPVALAHRRQCFQAGSWSQPDEVHGTAVVDVRRHGAGDRHVADAVVTSLFGEVLGIWVGDCAPVALVAVDGTIAGVHAGWRGALDGILDQALDHLPAGGVEAVLGPCIHSCCYEFGTDDLAAFVAAFGPQVAGTTSWGTAALDMPAVVGTALARRGVTVTDRSECTGCGAGRWFSHRRRGERGRQVLTVVKRRAA
jgi:copper oxidase (laccase) domain-containing protein